MCLCVCHHVLLEQGGRRDRRTASLCGAKCPFCGTSNALICCAASCLGERLRISLTTLAGSYAPRFLSGLHPRAPASIDGPHAPAISKRWLLMALASACAHTLTAWWLVQVVGNKGTPWNLSLFAHSGPYHTATCLQFAFDTQTRSLALVLSSLWNLSIKNRHRQVLRGRTR